MITVFGRHIELQIHNFYISFIRSAYTNVLSHPEEQQVIKVRAETEKGALHIAEYHYGLSGRNFHCISPEKTV